MTHYAFQVNVTMKQLSGLHYAILAECWRSDCKEKAIFIFNFMDNPFPTCSEHAEEFFKVLKETYRIFLMIKGSDEV